MRIKKYRPRRKFRDKILARHKVRKFFLGLSVIFSLSVIFYMWLGLPSVWNADELVFAQSTIIYDRKALDKDEDENDHILYIIHGDENREFVPLGEMSKYIVDGTIAIEDDGFYRHFGFDLGGIFKSALNYFFGIGKKRGGSTITQQLVKNSFLSEISTKRTLSRKIDEILLAIKWKLDTPKKKFWKCI